MEVNKEHGPKASGCVTKKLISFEEMPALYNIQKVSQNYFPFEQLSAVVYRRDGSRKIFVQCSENILRFNN